MRKGVSFDVWEPGLITRRDAYEVDTSELLKSLQSHTSEDTKSDVVLAASEAVDVGAAVGLSEFVFDGGLHVVGFSLQFRRARFETGDFGDGAHGFFLAALEDEPSGRLGEEVETDGEDEGPDELNADGNLVAGDGIHAFGALDHTGGDKEADGNHPSVGGERGKGEHCDRKAPAR